MHVNKVHRVTTIDRVAADLGESIDWLYDVAREMDAEDGVIWVYGLGDEQLMAFTNFGIETLVDLIKIHKDDPTLLKRCEHQTLHAGGLRRMATHHYGKFSRSWSDGQEDFVRRSSKSKSLSPTGCR